MSEAILGISAYYHDSAAALIVDGDIVAAAHEERFTRKKQDSGFPVHAVNYVLDEAGLQLSDINAVVFYDKPFVKFERLLETYHSFAPLRRPRPGRCAWCQQTAPCRDWPPSDQGSSTRPDTTAVNVQD